MSRRSRCSSPRHHHAGTADDDIGLMPVELGLGDADGGIEVVVGEGGIEDGRGRGI